MDRKEKMYKSWSVVIVLISLLLSQVVVASANEIVPVSDITGGTSVFIFRGSSKKPQAGTGSVRAYLPRAATASSNRARINAQAAAKRRQRVNLAKARAVAVARQRARERNARLRQSNILTARAETQLETGELETATANFREALRLNADNAEAKNGLSDALTASGLEAVAAGRDEDALASLNEAVKFDARNDIAFVKLGEIHDAAGRNNEAINNFEKALEIDPEIDSIYFPLGMAYAEDGNDVKADEFLAKAEAKGVTTAESRLLRAMILARQGKDAEAISAIESSIRIDPAYGPAYIENYRLLEGSGRKEESIATLQKGSVNAADYAPIWFNLGVIYYNREDYAKAETAYLEAIRLDPTHAQANANLASTYRQMERFGEANAQYRAANEKGIDGNADLYSEWGFCLGKTKEWDKAAVRLESAEKLSPTAIDHNNLGWAHYNAARQYMETENDDEAARTLALARSAFEKATTSDPNLSAAFLNLGSTNNSLGDYDAAAAALNRALSIENNWVLAMNQLGLAYRGSNDLQRAIDQFVRTTTLDANNVFGLYYLGELYHLTGKKSDARRVRDRLQRVDPVAANRLNDVFTGKIVLDEAKRKLRQRIRVPRLPF